MRRLVRSPLNPDFLQNLRGIGWGGNLAEFRSEKPLRHQMILIDTSAWVQYLNHTNNPVVTEISSLINNSIELAITEPIIMELLAGAKTQSHEDSLTSLVNSLSLVAINPALDYPSAAKIFAAASRHRYQILSLHDALIAAIAIRSGVSLLNWGRSFRYLAEFTTLQLTPPAHLFF